MPVVSVVLADFMAQHGARSWAGSPGADTEARGPIETGTVSVRLAAVTEGSSFTRSSASRNGQVCERCSCRVQGPARPGKDSSIEACLTPSVVWMPNESRLIDHEQGERAGELAHHQRLRSWKWRPGRRRRRPPSARESGRCGWLAGGDESEDESGCAGEERGEQEDAGVGLKVVGDGDQQRHSYAGQECMSYMVARNAGTAAPGRRSCFRASTGGRCARGRRRARGERQSPCGGRRPGPASCCRRWRRRSAGSGPTSR